MNLKSLLSWIRYGCDMGLRYMLFRFWYELQHRMGLLKYRFPVDPPSVTFISLGKWRSQNGQIFFERDIQGSGYLVAEDRIALSLRVEMLYKCKFLFFSSVYKEVNDWHTNPESGYKYNQNQHWTQISDFSQEAGDIKYVWERSRFTFLYDLIRYDFHFKKDQSEKVFSEILDWIKQNPVNCGPNWICSQEISLRVLNWTFALNYYKHSPALTEKKFDLILNSIYRQIQHVSENISFSRIAVRNNHALTETLTLYITGLLYPFFPESDCWKSSGKRWFTEEIAFQIADDGTFLQHSMNYHRVVVQLLSWAIGLAKCHNEQWVDVVYEKARKSLYFLNSCQDKKTGWLPNYGHNDGALFFPMTSCHFRDFRPQLLALANVLEREMDYGNGKWQEESFWLGSLQNNSVNVPDTKNAVENTCSSSFKNGGYFLIRDRQTLTFLKCSQYNTRPAQADNLHLDIWVGGENILRDAGSYKYHADEDLIRYFFGTSSHNTVMVGNFDQMQKGPRFIWYDWLRKSSASCVVGDQLVISGEFEGFCQAGKGIVHKRIVTKVPGELYWIIEDQVDNVPVHLPVHQIWHPSAGFFERFSIRAFGADGEEIGVSQLRGWYSESYGLKVEATRLAYSSFGRKITTIIKSRSLS